MKQISCASTLFAFFSMAHVVNANTIEIMHHWLSLSESSALQVFEDAYTARGGDWIEDRQPNQATHNKRGFERLRDGFPPTTMQSQATGLQEFYRSGVLTTLEELVDETDLAGIAPELRELITFDQKTAAVPVTVHGSNWIYYNQNIMAEYGYQPARNWDEFFAQMEALQADGKPSVAIGPDRWERMLVLEMILLAEGGPSLLEAFNQGKIDDKQRPAFSKALQHFIRFQSLVVQSGVPAASSNAASLLVAEGRAAVQVMGDWGKGEMVAAGFKPGEDFICALAPGTSETYILILDIFLLPRSDRADDIAAQRDFVSIALDPATQAEFSRRKGSLPVVGVNRANLDECGRLGLDTIAQHGFQVAHNRLVAAPGVEAAIDQFVQDVMDQRHTDAVAAEEALLGLFRSALGG